MPIANAKSRSDTAMPMALTFANRTALAVVVGVGEAVGRVVIGLTVGGHAAGPDLGRVALEDDVAGQVVRILGEPMRATDTQERVDVLSPELDEAQLFLGQPDRGLDLSRQCREQARVDDADERDRRDPAELEVGGSAEVDELADAQHQQSTPPPMR